MARAVTPAKTRQPPAKAARPSTKPQRAPAAKPVAKISKDELRAQVEKLERANATLRLRSREANKAAKAAAVRIAELEEQVTRLERQAASAAKPAKPAKPARKPARRDVADRQTRDIDPGDAVPPGVAVLEPEPLDNEAEAALESLEKHLGHE